VGGDQPQPDVLVEIRVRDEQVAANQARWLLRIRDGAAASVTASPATDGGNYGSEADATVDTDAPTLARVFAGEVSPRDAARLGQLEVRGDAALLDAAFATRSRFWLFDEF
jgi:hypothetical protein